MNAPRTIAVPADELEQVRQLLSEMSVELEAAAKALRRFADRGAEFSRAVEHVCDGDDCLLLHALDAREPNKRSSVAQPGRHVGFSIRRYPLEE